MWPFDLIRFTCVLSQLYIYFLLHIWIIIIIFHAFRGLKPVYHIFTYPHWCCIHIYDTICILCFHVWEKIIVFWTKGENEHTFSDDSWMHSQTIFLYWKWSFRFSICIVVWVSACLVLILIMYGYYFIIVILCSLRVIDTVKLWTNKGVERQLFFNRFGLFGKLFSSNIPIILNINSDDVTSTPSSSTSSIPIAQLRLGKGQIMKCHKW